MNRSCFVLIFAISISVSWAFECPGRHCSVTRNENNQTVFDCAMSQSTNNASVVSCFYFANKNKIILNTKDAKYIPIDKIATGAFSRLVSGLFVDKLYINKLQFKTLNQRDFDSLINISEMRIENPNTLASNTFLSLAAKTKYFILTISCSDGNSQNSFDTLYLMSDKWRLNTHNCYKKMSCEFSTCDTRSQHTMSKISSSNLLVGTQYLVAFQSCTLSPSCITDEVTTTAATSVTRKYIADEVPTTMPIKRVNIPIANEHKTDEHYDSLMYIVLVLTSVNSIVILGILVFLIVWWNKLSTSTTNNKHTIVLDDEDDSKYLNFKP